MSMNGFFRSFTREQLDTMRGQPALIAELVWEKEAFEHSTDVETAWDVLSRILGEAGFRVDSGVDGALSNGCGFVSPESVAAQHTELSSWTPERVLDGLHRLDPEADLYHLEYILDDGEDGDEYVVEQFDKLVAFYRDASAKGLGAVHYLA